MIMRKANRGGGKSRGDGWVKTGNIHRRSWGWGMVTWKMVDKFWDGRPESFPGRKFAIWFRYKYVGPKEVAKVFIWWHQFSLW
jgi:hypothetical protein